jgi:mono/diheme cytochrome c family protein
LRIHSITVVAAATAAIALSLAGTADAQEKGKKDYVTYCADCHGTAGTGNGVAAREIPGAPPPDLTTMARRNGGVFPAAAVTDLIDGRKQIPSHARLAMPFWGVTLQRPGEEFSPQSDAEVKERIGAIVDYLKSIQRK